jgi:hypothetical protein
MDREKIINSALFRWGTEAQMQMCIEECSELIKAICKMHRADMSDSKEWQACIEAVVDEVADVQIMLDQMKIVFGDSVAREEFKLKRLAERLGLEDGQQE